MRGFFGERGGRGDGVVWPARAAEQAGRLGVAEVGGLQGGAGVGDGAEDGARGAAGLGVVVLLLLGGVQRRREESREGLEGLGLEAGVGEFLVGADVGLDVGAGAEGDDVERGGAGVAGGGQGVEVVEEERGEGGAVLRREGGDVGCGIWDVRCGGSGGAIGLMGVMGGMGVINVGGLGKGG